MTEYKHKYASQLSGGCKRKLCLLFAIIGIPTIQVLDEPTESLDPEARQHFWALFKQTSQGKTVILSTHRLEEADAAAKNVVILRNGSVLESGGIKEMKNRFSNTYILRISGYGNRERLLNSISRYDLRVLYEDTASVHIEKNLSEFLEIVRENKGELNISLSSESLESVYLRIMNSQ
jgi:ABC-type multidrug transport system ATPase subunit